MSISIKPQLFFNLLSLRMKEPFELRMKEPFGMNCIYPSCFQIANDIDCNNELSKCEIMKYLMTHTLYTSEK